MGYLKKYLQEGGEMMGAEQPMEQPMEGQAPQDPQAQMMAIAQSIVEQMGPDGAMQLAQIIVEMVGQAGGGPEAPMEEAPPAFKRGGKLTKKKKKSKFNEEERIIEGKEKMMMGRKMSAKYRK